MKTATKVAGFTAEGVFVKLSVPEGMDAALQGLTREVLRHQPDDIYWFAAHYFENLVRSRGGGHVQEIASCRETRSSRKESGSRSKRASGASGVVSGGGGGVASLAATTGTVAVLATASASHPSAPPWEVHVTGHVEEHVAGHVQEHVSTSRSHGSHSTSKVVSRQSETLQRTKQQQSTERLSSQSSEDTPRQSNTNKSQRTSKKQRSSKKSREKDSGDQNEPGTPPAQITTSESKKLESELSSNKYGEITRQVNTIVQEIAHDTVLKTEEISKKASEIGDRQSNVDEKIESEASTTKDKLGAKEEKVGVQSKRGTRKLKRQTKSVDSTSFSDRSEGGGENVNLKSDESEIVNQKNTANFSESHSSNVIKQEEHFSSTATKEAVELQELRDWVENDGTNREGVENITLEQVANNTISSSTDPVLPQVDFSHYETSYVSTNTEQGDNPNDIKAEELRVQSEGSVRKSSLHDISQEALEDGSQKTVEEKAEETKEEKHEASEKTVLERKSNVQVDENGDVVEEEITITRTEQSSKHETTVSKSWTMETTIETLADGETRVVERMILHSPPASDDTEKEASATSSGEAQPVSPLQEENEILSTVSTVESQDAKEERTELTESSEKLLSSTILEEKISSTATESVSENITLTEGTVQDDTLSPDAKKEFGLLDANDAAKSVAQISIALENAEKTLGTLQEDQHTPEIKTDPTESIVSGETRITTTETVLSGVQSDTQGVEVDEDAKEIEKKSIEQVSEVPEQAEQSLELQSSDYVTPGVKSVETNKDSEVDENGKALSRREFGLIDLEETKKSMEHISHALTSAEESLVKPAAHLERETLLESVQDEKKEVELSGQDQLSVKDGIADPAIRESFEVDEDGKPILTEGKETVSVTETHVTQMNDSNGDINVLESTTVTVLTSTVNESDDKQDEIIPPLDIAETEKGSDSSKEGSKEETSSNPKGVSSQAPDYPTDEDQATPRDDVESLRVDTPEDSSGTKSSTESDENENPINPPTVVISRTADVIELKDSEVNIVTQMEKEGLVFKDGVTSALDETVEDIIITQGALQTLGGASADVILSPKLSPVVVGIVASSVELINAEREGDQEKKIDDTDDTVEIVAAGFDNHQFIQEEAKHSSWLLEQPSTAGKPTKEESVHAITSASEHDLKSEQKSEVATTVQNVPKNDDNDLELDENGKPIPVDENGKPMYASRKKRSLGSKEDVSIANVIIPENSGVQLTRTGSIVGKKADEEHWYGSQMPLSGSTLIKPALAMARDPSIASLQPCDEPECIAVDVRDKSKSDIITTSGASTALAGSASDMNELHSTTGGAKQGVDVMKEMSLVTSRIGQSILSLGSEGNDEEEGKVEGEDRPAPARSSSQESFIISEDAVYIPLNPPGMKQPSLERIDSVPSISEAVNENIVQQNEHSSTLVLVESGAHDGDAGSPKTYTVTEPASGPVSNDRVEDQISDINPDDDVLIVEYPSDPLAKVTNWDNVVVASPADMKEDLVAKEEIQRMESMPVEGQSYISIDDSLQEVPSLQDEAVLHVESESELLDSMPEEEAERKWTDDVAKVANKAKDAVKGIFSRGSSVQQDDSKQSPEKEIVAVSNAADFVSDVKSAVQEDVHSLTKNVSAAVEGTASDAKDIAAAAGDDLESAGRHISHALSETVEDTRDAVQSAAEGVEKTVESTAHKISDAASDGIKAAKEKASEIRDGLNAKVSSVKENITSTASSVVDKAAEAYSVVEENIKESTTAAVESVASKTEEISSNISEGVHKGEAKLESAVQKLGDLSASVAEKAKDSVSSAIHEAKEVGREAKDSAEAAIVGAAEAMQTGATEVAEGISTVASDVKESAVGLATDLKEDSETIAHKIAHEVKDTTKATIDSGAQLLSSALESGKETVDSLSTATEEGVQRAKDAADDVGEGVRAGMATVEQETSGILSSVKAGIAGAAEGVESAATSVTDAIGSAAHTVSDEIHGGVSTVETSLKSAQKEAEHLAEETKSGAVSLVEAAGKASSDAMSSIGNAGAAILEAGESAKEGVASGVSAVQEEGKELLEAVAGKVADGVEDAESLARHVEEQAENAVRAAVENVETEEASLHRALSAIQEETKEKVTSSIKEADDETVRALELAEASVQEALDHAEMTISSESQKALSALHVTESTRGSERTENDTSTVEHIAKGDEDATLVEKINQSVVETQNDTVVALEHAEETVKNALDRAEETITAEARRANFALGNDQAEDVKESIQNQVETESEVIHRSVKHEIEEGGQGVATAVDATVAALELAEKSVKTALNQAEETISTEARKGLSHLTTESKTVDTMSSNHTIISTAQDITVTTLERAEETVRTALNRAEETIASEATKALSMTQSSSATQEIKTTSSSNEVSSEERTEVSEGEVMEKTVSTATLVHNFSEGIHDRVKREVSSLRDKASPRDRSQDSSSSSRRGRATSDITQRKAPSKSDSWESNLRKNTVSSSGKIARTASVSGGETGNRRSSSQIPRATNKKPPATPLQVEGTAQRALPADARRRAPLRKAKSLAEDSSEETKKRVKKMPSQGSTRKTAISVESAVEAAGETVVKEALDKARAAPDSSEETVSEASKSTSITTSSATQKSEEVTETKQSVKSELVQAAATIQDTFREHRMVPVDENGKELSPPNRSGLQIEPVLEEIAEEGGVERQGDSRSRRDSRQDSQGADNEDTSTSESSLSSAATRIQAGFRGHLARRHRLTGRHGSAGTSASTSASMSMSRDSDVGVVRAMSLLEDSEVQRHQLDPQSTLDQLPEADDLEYGPAKYVADVHRARAETQAEHSRKGLEWARSLDSGLSSGPERHTPVRSSVSVHQRALRDGDLDEHVWRTLEQEMLTGEGGATDDSGQGEGARRGPRRSLHRGNAMQMPTTSSSTPGSLDESQTPAGLLPSTTRHTGEFHDMLVLPLPPNLPPGPPDPQPAPPPQQQELKQLPPRTPPTSASSPPTEPDKAKASAQREAAAEAPDVATSSPPPHAEQQLGSAGSLLLLPSDDEEEDFSLPSNISMKTAEAAATKIQAGFRGYKVRRQLREQSQDGQDRLSSKDTDNSSSGRGDAEHDNPAASSTTPPQPNATPGQQCRSTNLHHLSMTGERGGLEAGVDGLDEELVQRSAARIQAGVRGFLVRRRQHNAALAAAKIQAGFRGFRTRRELKQRLRKTSSSGGPGAPRQQQATPCQ